MAFECIDAARKADRHASKMEILESIYIACPRCGNRHIAVQEYRQVCMKCSHILLDLDEEDQ